MKTHYLAFLLFLASFSTGYFLATQTNTETAVSVKAPLNSVQSKALVTEKYNENSNSVSCNQSGQKNEVTKLTSLLEEKNKLLESQRKELSTMKVVSNRYNVIMESFRPQGYAPMPSITENFEPDDMFFRFFQLSPTEKIEINEITQNALTSIQGWEIINSYRTSKEEDKITYEIPPGGDEISSIKNKFVEDLLKVIGQDDSLLINKFSADLFDQFSFRRVVSLEQLDTKNNPTGTIGVRWSVEMFDNNRRRRSSTSSSSNIPKRFNHLFN